MLKSDLIPLVEKIAAEERCPARLVHMQIEQESKGVPDAKSNAGACGLLQIMPKTFADLVARHGFKNDIFDIETNLRAGCRYLREQFDALKKLIPDETERWKFALGSYNGGRGYIEVAIRLAREATDNPHLLFWEICKLPLAFDECRVAGRRPDYNQIWDYVRKIWRNYTAE